MPGRSRSKTPDAVLASLVAHVLLLAGLALSARVYRPPEQDPAVQLTIVPDVLVRGQPSPVARGFARTRARSSARPLRQPQAAAPAPSAPVAGPPPPAPSPDAAADAEQLRSVLQGLTACAGANVERLDAEGRKRCDEQAAKTAARPIGPLQADRFVQAPQAPMLVRKPHNGCLPRLADRPGPANLGSRSAASTTGGLGCAWSF